MLLHSFFLLLAVRLVSFASGQPHTDLQGAHDAAVLARQVISDAGIGTILTIMDDEYLPGFDGHPFGMMEWYSGDYFNNGDLLLYMSNLQMSVKNILRRPTRVSFAVRALKEYDNPKWGNTSSPIQLPRLSLLGEISLLPPDK
ncbi:hypothetical protein BX666DRAFT_1137575 [Dichotomocladium elegans]|nr:hypothetical protein BX666DRAFT_1137575 [Dichotomocladium elegans]